MVTQNFDDKNVLILGAPRSGTHALASIIEKHNPQLQYLGEICQHQTSEEPWEEFKLFYDNTPKKLAHVVQYRSKIFSLPSLEKIKKHTVLIELRRRNKIKQFASWMFFKHIGALYEFQHDGQDYLPPGSLTATLEDIESFIVSQLIDMAFDPDYIWYYEDLDLRKSSVRKNQYVYPIEQIFSNLDLVEKHLADWKYYK